MTLVLLDTNTYLRLAKRIRPLLGVKFGQKDYVLTVLKDVEDEVRRSPKLRFNHPWFDEATLGAERDAKQVRLSDDEKRQSSPGRDTARRKARSQGAINGRSCPTLKGSRSTSGMRRRRGRTLPYRYTRHIPARHVRSCPRETDRDRHGHQRCGVPASRAGAGCSPSSW